MNRLNTKSRTIAVTLLLALLLVVPAASLAQDEADCNNPAEERLAKALGVTCQKLHELRAEGYGPGEIMKAWYLAKDLEVFGDWEDLLAMKKADNIGWGQLKAAARLADGDEEQAKYLLEKKLSGVGWGQIKKAQAIVASSELSLDDALTLVQQGGGWNEIRDELGLEEGPPPWAGPKDKDKTTGPPSWANNDKKSED